ncbi:helix-turn-helix domain-containing protein [Nocardia cyriacigeorgica]|uniref:helix-turn-helix domain-containing protein n=1 Tax=Nocardia cyriacigeorgica TaxID=135487 RepID=UPI0024548DE6|nr:helix-turn-helix domain-containing protein [Nocardia cyriacigeorgica]
MRHLTVQPAPSRFTPKGRKHARYEMNTRYAGAPGYVPSGPVRQHIIDLMALGLPLASIARDAGCAESCVVNLHRGLYPTTRIRQAEAIMAVTHHPNPRQQNVLAIGAARRLQALHAIGWTWRALAAHTPGVTATAMSQMTRKGGGRTLIAWATWVSIRDAYERLSGTPGTEGRITLARNHAARQGWHPPLEWEDLDIDDPRVTPCATKARRAEQRAEAKATRIAEVARLTAAGLTAQEIAERLGVTRRQVVRDRRDAQTTPEHDGDDLAVEWDEIAC